MVYEVALQVKVVSAFPVDVSYFILLGKTFINFFLDCIDLSRNLIGLLAHIGLTAFDILHLLAKFLDDFFFDSELISRDLEFAPKFTLLFDQRFNFGLKFSKALCFG